MASRGHKLRPFDKKDVDKLMKLNFLSRDGCVKRGAELTSEGWSVLSDQQAMVMAGTTSDQPASVHVLLRLPATNTHKHLS